MGIEALKQAINELEGAHAISREPMSRHTPLRVGGTAELWVWVYTEKALLQAMKLARKQKLKSKIHWPFADWLVRDGGFKGIVIRPAGVFSEVQRGTQGPKLGSSALWSSAHLVSPGFDEFKTWSGSVGALFENKEQGCLKGFPMRIHYIQGRDKKIVEIDRRKEPPELPKSSILTKIEILGPRRKRPGRPNRSGMLFRTLKGKNTAEMFSEFGLCGVRLRDWLMTEESPGRIVNLSSGNCKDLLLLSKGLQERMKRLSGQQIEIRIPVFGSEEHKR